MGFVLLCLRKKRLLRLPRYSGGDISVLEQGQNNCRQLDHGSEFVGLEGEGGLIHEGSIWKKASSFFTPRDVNGHGLCDHTYQQAGGNFVAGANVFGLGNGTAKGGSPKARVAAYKVCWSEGCTDADILLVLIGQFHRMVCDVLSVSLAADQHREQYFEDSLAIGSFHAVKNGICCGCLSWRKCSAAKHDFQLGSSIHFFLLHRLELRLMHPFQAKMQSLELFDPIKVKGENLLVCLRGKIDEIEKEPSSCFATAGAVGMRWDFAIFDYINKTRNPCGSHYSYKHTIGVKPSPAITPFSSRGPNTINPDILKPDISAPGVNVIAAFTEATGPTKDLLIKITIRGIVSFNILSGTSMSCPHVTGIVGLLQNTLSFMEPCSNQICYYDHWDAIQVPSPHITLSTSTIPQSLSPHLKGTATVTRKKNLKNNVALRLPTQLLFVAVLDSLSLLNPQFSQVRKELQKHNLALANVDS
nr:subtilisin-like protease SBT5.3 [Ipomoea batatas]